MFVIPRRSSSFLPLRQSGPYSQRTSHCFRSRKYNIPNIGIYYGGSQLFDHARPFKLDDRRYLFDALGKDIELYNNPRLRMRSRTSPTNQRSTAHHAAYAASRSRQYYGADNHQFGSILVNLNGIDVSAVTTNASPQRKVIDVCDLSDITDGAGNVIGWAHKPKSRISIDPVLGRLAFPENDPPPRSVHVSYNYGFSTEMGGGEYGRGATFGNLDRVIRVPTDRPTLQAAIAALLPEVAASTELPGGAIEIEKPPTVADSVYHELSGTITIPAGKVIEIRGADQHRPVIRLNGDWSITGGGEGQLLLNGLVITGGSLRVPATALLRTLRLTHCAVVPGPVQAPLTSPPSG